MVACLEQRQKNKESVNTIHKSSSTICVCSDCGKSAINRKRRRFSKAFRKKKVLNIRRRLRDGTYDLDKHLDASLTEILDDLH